MDDTPTFADVLRHLRRKRGLSLREFQRVTHHSKSLLWEWENGHKIPAPDVVDRLDLVLDAGGALVAAAAAAAPAFAGAVLASEITRHYAHQGPVADQIRRRAADAKELDVLAVRALGLVALKDALLRPALTERADPLRVRVLLLDPDCDAAKQRAAEIREAPATFAAGIRLALAHLDEAGAGLPVDLDVRLYTRLPVWRIIRLDETAWVSAFSPSWEGHESTIHEIQHTPRGSFWAGFRRQFDDIHANSRRVI